jgi:hypothetical protein
MTSLYWVRYVFLACFLAFVVCFAITVYVKNGKSKWM